MRVGGALNRKRELVIDEPTESGEEFV